MQEGKLDFRISYRSRRCNSIREQKPVQNPSNGKWMHSPVVSVLINQKKFCSIQAEVGEVNSHWRSVSSLHYILKYVSIVTNPTWNQRLLRQAYVSVVLTKNTIVFYRTTGFKKFVMKEFLSVPQISKAWIASAHTSLYTFTRRYSEDYLIEPCEKETVLPRDFRNFLQDGSPAESKHCILNISLEPVRIISHVLLH